MRTIHVRDIRMGGGAPVSIQSMTNTDTRDAAATVCQIKELEQAGCEIVRVSVYDETCACAIREIKSQIRIPLVADVHFDHRLAIASIENGVDKVRINPGNIGGENKVRELVACLKTHHIPVRIGVNAGSLEKNLSGTVPERMVESAMRHIKMLEDEGFYDIVISLKASNVNDTVAAYRLIHEQIPYPLHLGVTEAGMGELAYTKSAIGIGALLLDGIGDTIRVSLTGDPVQEVHAARQILRAVGLRKEGVEIISCPTCGRCQVALADMVERVQNELPGDLGYLKVAVMGCAVNGPGEAKEADIGIAFGRENGVLFKKGEQFAVGSQQEMMERLVCEARNMLVMQAV